MGKLGWSSPFSQSMVDGWEAYSKVGEFAARAAQVRNNILGAAIQPSSKNNPKAPATKPTKTSRKGK